MSALELSNLSNEARRGQSINNEHVKFMLTTFTNLMEDVFNDDLDKVKKKCKGSATVVNQPSDFGNKSTPLIVAAQYKRITILDYLLSLKGTNVDGKNSLGNSDEGFIYHKSPLYNYISFIRFYCIDGCC